MTSNKTVTNIKQSSCLLDCGINPNSADHHWIFKDMEGNFITKNDYEEKLENNEYGLQRELLPNSDTDPDIMYPAWSFWSLVDALRIDPSKYELTIIVKENHEADITLTLKETLEVIFHKSGDPLDVLVKLVILAKFSTYCEGLPILQDFVDGWYSQE